MGFVRFSGIPGRRAHATVLDVFSSRFIFIPLFIILVAACLVITGCTDEEVIGPGDDDNPDDPICPLNTPWVEIVSPDAGDSQYYPPRIEFSWEQDPEYMIAFTRYLFIELAPGETGTDMLNEHPEQFDGLWTEWKQWDPAGDSALIGEEDPLENGIYFFAVQAKDSCGKKTDHFDVSYNTRQFAVQTFPPVLVIWEPMLGSGTFIGTGLRPPAALVLPDIAFSFQWHAESSYSWFAPVQYRYGWDIQNLGDDGEWAFPWSSQIKGSWSKSFNSGVHVFHVEARDDAGTITRARVEIEIIPYTRERHLLWIDDCWLGDEFDPLRRNPTETEHDEFWAGICSRAPGFDPVRDIYDADINNRGDQLPLSVLADYRNVVWTYDSSSNSAWSNSIRFEPAPIMYFPRPNNFRMFLAAGGSAFTCGKNDRAGGGLSETFPESPQYPSSVIDDLADYDYDKEYAKHSMAYNDYYVTVVDRVTGYFRTDLPGGVYRNLDRDAMMMAVETGPAYYFDFPDTLTLSDEVTQPGMFFDPTERGFYYVEAYDPEYYMDHIMEYSHSCFTPIYRMKSRSTLSPLNDSAIAMRVTIGYDRYTGHYYHCEPHRQAPYESYHFGIPLWFIDHGQVEQIADFIFEQWDIR